jgi:GGDEF domain-containing protein
MCTADRIRVRVVPFDLMYRLESTVFWIVSPSSLERARRFGETYRLQLQGRFPPASADVLLVVLFRSED